MLNTKKNAFLLIELLVVITIILTLCSLSVPIFFNRSKNDLFYDMQKIEAMLTYLRESAMASGQPIVVAFNVADNSYAYAKGRQNARIVLSPSIQFGYLKDTRGPPAHPKKLVTNPITFELKNTPDTLKLLPNGRVTPGTIYLTDKKRKLMGALTCGVSQVSYIRQYIYQSKNWQLIDG